MEDLILMEETDIRNIKIHHDKSGKISNVTIDGKKIRDNISSGFNLIKIQFNFLRPDNAEIILPAEYEIIFQSCYSVVDELYGSDRGCLAAHLSSFLFESLTPFWTHLMEKGQHILAIQFWRKILSSVHGWEKKTGKHIHKGSPYAFIANTYLINGDIDAGFSYIYKAIEEDIKLNNVCPELNYPSNAPVYLTACLSSNPNNIMFPLVNEIRSELEKYLMIYRNEFKRTFTITELDKQFLQNPALEAIKYYFVFNFWMIFEYRRRVSHDLMHNDFSRLKNTNWLFALCLVIDKLFHSHSKYNDRFIGSEIVKYVVDKALMKKNDLNNLKDKENIQNGEPDQVIPKLLPMTLQYNGVLVRKEIQYLLVTWNLRNFAGHNIKIQNVIVNHFEDLLKILLCNIFLIIEEY